MKITVDDNRTIEPKFNIGDKVLFECGNNLFKRGHVIKINCVISNDGLFIEYTIDCKKFLNGNNDGLFAEVHYAVKEYNVIGG